MALYGTRIVGTPLNTMGTPVFKGNARDAAPWFTGFARLFIRGSLRRLCLLRGHGRQGLRPWIAHRTFSHRHPRHAGLERRDTVIVRDGTYGHERSVTGGDGN